MTQLDKKLQNDFRVGGGIKNVELILKSQVKIILPAESLVRRQFSELHFFELQLVSHSDHSKTGIDQSVGGERNPKEQSLIKSSLKIAL